MITSNRAASILQEGARMAVLRRSNMPLYALAIVQVN